MLTKLDRYHGAMVGTLCGDALGAPYEWQKSADIKADLQARGGLVPHEYEPFDYIEPWKKVRKIKAGQPTDDSELAAALAMSLIESRGLSDGDLFAKLRSFIIDRKSVLTESAYGSGSTLKAALTPPTYESSQRLFAADGIPTPPSNGSLMRCIAVPLVWNRRRLWEIVEAASRQSKVTHRNPLSVAACMAFSAMVNLVLNGYDVKGSWETTRAALNATNLNNDPNMRQVIDLNLSTPTDQDIWPEPPRGPGDALTSLRVAVWASVEAKDFADGIVKAISVGGDTDTYAAIAGGILGARFGIQGIPAKWKDVLQGREIMEDLAGKLYELAHR